MAVQRELARTMEIDLEKSEEKFYKWYAVLGSNQ